MGLYLNIRAHIEFSYQSKRDNVQAQIYWNKADDNLLQWQGINTDQNQVKIKDLFNFLRFLSQKRADCVSKLNDWEM